LLDEHGRITGRQVHGGWPRDVIAYDRRAEIPSMLKYDTYMSLPTTILPKQFYEDAGGFDPTLTAADLDFQLKLLAMGKRTAFIDVPSVAIRYHADNASGEKYVTGGRQLREQIEILRRCIGPDTAEAIRNRPHATLTTLNWKIANLRRYPDAFQTVMPQVQSALDEIGSRVESIRSSPRALHPALPRVTVICPTTGALPLLNDALESLCGQTYHDWECIVVSDGGPNVESCVRRFGDANRFRYVMRSTRAGASAARNVGVELARGEILCYLDDDNVYSPNHLAELIQTYDASGAGFVVSSGEWIVESPATGSAGGRVPLARLPFRVRSDAADAIACAPSIPLDAVAHARNLCDIHGSFNEQLTVLGGWEFLLRLLFAGVNVAATQHAGVDVRFRSGFVDRQLRLRWNAYGAELSAIFAGYAPRADARIVAAWREQGRRVARANDLMSAVPNAELTLDIVTLLSGMDVPELVAAQGGIR
ncbi:MAG TPA: glycosyltransferase, partial [Candidatus Baltobacteraceae bacterium]|nr:glycosyltransferase [Candidatus Baltobacteraceae bacterium]